MRRIAARFVVIAGSLVAALFLATAANAGTTYTNSPAWNGSDYVWAWGPSDTPTYGETVPGNGQELSSFTFYLDANPNIVFRAAVATWDGEKAGSTLWMSGDMTTGGANGTFTPVTAVLPQGITLQEGQQYVLFLTTLFSGQPESAYGENDGKWGGIPNDVTDSFPGGSYVYSNTTDGASLFTGAWDGGPDGGYSGSHDVAFVADFGAPVSSAIDLVNACADGNAFRAGDGSFGSFVTIGEAEFNTGTFTDGMGATWSVTPANFVQGIGATCADPQGLGYVYAGYKVDSSGAVDGDAPQFDIYPYWLRPAK